MEKAIEIGGDNLEADYAHIYKHVLEADYKSYKRLGQILNEVNSNVRRGDVKKAQSDLEKAIEIFGDAAVVGTAKIEFHDIRNLDRFKKLMDIDEFKRRTVRDIQEYNKETHPQGYMKSATKKPSLAEYIVEQVWAYSKAEDEKAKFEDSIRIASKARTEQDVLEILSGLSNGQKAIGFYEEATNRKDKSEVWLQKARDLDNLGNYEEAIECYGRAININPDDWAAWYSKGWALCKLGRYEEAIGSFEDLIRIRPDDANAWYSKGVALAGLDRYEDAIKSYEEAIRIDPYLASAWYNMACSNVRLGEVEKALSHLEKAIEIGGDAYIRYAIENRAFDDIQNLKRFKKLMKLLLVYNNICLHWYTDGNIIPAVQSRKLPTGENRWISRNFEHV